VGQPLIKATVENHLLERANGRLFASQAVALQFAGPPLGGLLFAVAVPAPFWVNALTFAIAALLVTCMRTQRKERPALRPKVAEGLRWLVKHKALRTVTVVSATTNLCIAMTAATLVLFAQHRLGLTDAGFGALLATLACGGVAGGMLAERLLGYRNTVTVTVVLIPLMWLGIATVAHDLPTVAVFAVVSSFCTAVWGVATATLRQRAVPTDLLGRVSSAQTLITWGVQPIGALLGGLTADYFGLLAPWFVAVALRTAVGLICLKPLRAHFLAAALNVHLAASPEHDAAVTFPDASR
jgi:predicted MFS family arabinose efflux permease